MEAVKNTQDFETVSGETAFEREEEREWLTAGRISQYLGKSTDWVNKRLVQYKHLAEERLDSQKRPRTYYPPTVIDLLEFELHEESLLPVVTDRDIALNGLSLVLNRDEKWIANRLPFLEIAGERKRNPVNNRSFVYFDKETDLPVLLAEDERMRSYPVATEDESTAEKLAELLGISKRALVIRLKRISLTPTVKMHPLVGQLYAFYDTEEALRQLRGVLVEHPLKGHHPSEYFDVPDAWLVPAQEPELTPALSRLLPTEKVTAENWRDASVCAEVDPELFSDITNLRQVRIAKKFCGSCAARLFCLDYAVANNEQEGIWGGLRPHERKKLKLAR